MLQVGVKVLLKNKDGRYLLLRRSLEKYPEVPNRWDIAGGRIDPGTTLLENLKREVIEETSLELKGAPRLVAAQDILRIKGRHVVRLTYIGEAEGEPRLDGEEHDMYKWVTIPEIGELTGVDIYFKELLDNKVIQ